jgi:hypothetical protein
MEAVSADVDQLTRHWVGVGVCLFAHGLVAAADRDNGQQRQHRVEQPVSASAVELSTRPYHYPDDQC